MQTLIFGDVFFAGRTQRALGGQWVDLETHKLKTANTLFIEAGSVIRPIPDWKGNTAVMAIGATHEDAEWKTYFDKKSRGLIPRSRSFYLSAKAVSKLQKLRGRYSFWEALRRLRVKSWVEPQLRSWHHPHMRVLQVVTSLHVGGAEKVCVDLAKMPEAIGIVSLGEPKRTPLCEATWDLSKLNNKQKIEAIINIARTRHADLIHTHLMTADDNAEIEKHFPLVTTIHNTPEGWPRGYDVKKPGLLVGCSKKVAVSLGAEARVAWNGISMPLTRKPRVVSKKEIRIIAVANYRPQKRLERIPAILKELEKMGYSPKLTVVGEIHYTDPVSKRSRDAFLRNVKRLKLTKRVEEVKSLDVRSALAKNHVFLSVSAHEGLSLSQLEALAAGLPVVATEVGGASEIRSEVKDGGYVTLPADASSKAFAAALLKVRTLPRINRLPKAFRTETMCRRYMQIYRNVLARGPRTDEIWLLTNNFSMGGAQSSAKRLLKWWSKGTTVRAFTLEEDSPTRGTKELMAEGISVENISGKNAAERTIIFQRKCAKSRPKALLFWNTMASTKCMIADGLNVPIIDVSPGEMYFKEMNTYLLNPLPELPVRVPEDYGRLLSASVVKYGREVESMSSFLQRTVVVVPNGVTGIGPHRRSFQKKRIFGTASRIAPHKRLEDLVEAFANMPAELYIAGAVEPGSEAYAAALKEKSPPNVHWLGPKNVKEFLPTLDIFVMISEPAGCPNASLEAMANGLPILITDVGGANEQAIDGLNGWLLPARDVDAMKKAIHEALQLPASTLKVMAKASLYHVGNFSMDKMLKRYLAIVSECEIPSRN